MIRLEPGGRDVDDAVGRVSQLMEHMLQKSFFKFRPCDRWHPTINFYETDDAYHLCADLAGVDPKQVELHVEGQDLRISGHRPAPTPEGAVQVRIHVMEIDHGSFQRSIEIPSNVDVHGIRARHRNGLVWIEMPKTISPR